jgi:hypothetical protein
MAFIGDPPLDRPEADEVHVSCTFTWDIKDRIIKLKNGRQKVIRGAETLQKSWAQYYPVVKLGGPAFDSPCPDFNPGLYIKSGVTFTSRGCNNQCPWCLVRKREGKLSYLPIQPGNIVNDNNLLQCDKAHQEKVFDMLRTQKAISFSGGLDCREMTQEIADTLRSLKILEMFFACDTKGQLSQLQRVGKMFPDTNRRKLRCYVLLAFNGQTIGEAIEHLENVWEAGFLPHAQLFQPDDKLIEYSPEWRHLSRRWSRPAATLAMNGKDSNWNLTPSCKN